MAIAPGTHILGPAQAVLSVYTGTSGAAARAGHRLRLEVGSWSAELRVAADPAANGLHLTADPASLRVREGHGGLQPLRDEDRRTIAQRIERQVLGRDPIEFRSSSVEPGADGERLRIQGELTLRGTARPLTFELHATGNGRLRARADVTQSAFGITPYSAMLGRLKVCDEVEVSLEGRLTAG
jgi:polyisoprenoid-binding protein YceI